MPKLNWLDTLFFGVRRVLSGGVELPERPALNFVGASVTDNPAENRIDVAFLGSSIRKISPVVTSSYTASPGELVRVDVQDPVTIPLPSAVGNAGAEVLVKEVAGNEELITIAAPPGQQIDRQAAVQIAGTYCQARFVSDAAEWLAF